MKNWSLENKTILITGGTKGIGRATVLEMLELGGSILFSGLAKRRK